MSAYLGTYGALREIKCPATEQVDLGERSSYRPTMGGRVVEQRGPRPRRSWSLGLSVAFPEDMRHFEALHFGSKDPLVWVAPDAASLNLLSPGASLLEPDLISPGMVRTGPAITDSDFFIPMTAMVPAGTTMTFGLSEPLPAIPGERMVAGVYTLGSGGTVRMVFRDAAGAWVDNVTTSTSAAWTRMTLARDTPDGAHDVLLQVTAGATSIRVGAPSATLGPTLMPWAVGRGCPKASISSASYDLIAAVRGERGMNMSSYSYSIREVG